jgi:hypothetical protein
VDNDKIEELFSRISKLFLETSGIKLFFNSSSDLLIRYSYMEDGHYISYTNNILLSNEISKVRHRGIHRIESTLDMKQLFLFDEDISIFSHIRFANEFLKRGNNLVEFETCEGAKMISEMGIPKSVEELSIKLDLLGF